VKTSSQILKEHQIKILQHISRQFQFNNDLLNIFHVQPTVM